MKDLVELRHFFNRVKDENLVLCTIVKKSGSSYRNVFAKKLVSLHKNEAYGLLSGGCLEKEIEEVARAQFDQLPFLKSFSTMSEEDRLLGYQKGCAGIIEILFEKLPSDPSLIDLYLPYGTQPQAVGVKIDLSEANLGRRSFVYQAEELPPDTLFEPWIRPIELTIVGCGADADPYLQLSQVLGWSVRFIDYRSDLARSDRFGGDVKPELIPLDKIADSIKEGSQSAVVLMTHSFESDLHIFSDLLERDLGYLGCVGPKRRYDLMKKDLKSFFSKEPSEAWEARVVKAPPGITPADHSPAEIAFSIAADIQKNLGASRHA